MNGTIADHLRGKRRVYFDSQTVIYLIEAKPRYLPVVRSLFDLVSNGSVDGVTSYLTLLEVLVQPIRAARLDLARKYKELLSHSRNVTLCPLNRDVAEKAAELRAGQDARGLRTPDAIQLATALCQAADAFVTNDKHIKKYGKFLDILVLDDFVIAQ